MSCDTKKKTLSLCNISDLSNAHAQPGNNITINVNVCLNYWLSVKNREGSGKTAWRGRLTISVCFSPMQVACQLKLKLSLMICACKHKILSFISIVNLITRVVTGTLKGNYIREIKHIAGVQHDYQLSWTAWQNPFCCIWMTKLQIRLKISDQHLGSSWLDSVLHTGAISTHPKLATAHNCTFCSWGGQFI